MKPLFAAAQVKIPGSDGGILTNILGSFAGLALVVIGISFLAFLLFKGMDAKKGNIAWSQFFKSAGFYLLIGALIVFGVSFFSSPNTTTNNNIKSTLDKGTEKASSDLNSALN